MGIVIMKRLAAILRPLSQQLLAKEADLVQALQLIGPVNEVLSKERDIGFQSLSQKLINLLRSWILIFLYRGLLATLGAEAMQAEATISRRTTA